MQRCLSYRSLAGLVLAVSLAACSANVDDDAASVNALAGADTSEASVNAQDYKSGASANPGVVDVSTVQQALTALTGNVDVSVNGFKAGVVSGGARAAVGGDEAGQSVNVACAGGGGADVDGHMNMAPAPVAIDVNVAIAFSGCATASGTMLDGNIEFSQGLTAGQPDANTPFQVETIYEGDINLSGNVNASCGVDLNVLVDQTGRALKVQGTLCNQDASELNMQLQPLWQ